ncbi:transmembrane protein 209 [Harpegnathos saltator]|uniref:Transmembrane protein 209 n=1 Tax=Harpegnathos saltator TaxID=610380 RepID=E2BCZ8_HARSA|nr:transmembrane protein 209 [Harpegnathos saltator]EFN86423.1 Transmembrane protein 209 [Harpegnathos saltator]
MSTFYSPMKCISPNARVLTPKPQVQQLLDLRLTQNKARNSITWFFINVLLLSIVLYDIMYDGPIYKPICWLEWCLASIFAINAFYHIIRYAWVTIRLQPITLKPKQRRLLGVSEDEPLFKNEELQQQKSPELSPSLNLSYINFNRRSIPLASSVLSEIKDYSTSTVFKYSSPVSPKSTVSSNGSLSKSMSISLNGSLTNEDLIRDECELENYLEEVEQQRKCMLSTNVDQPSNLLSSFWSHPAVRRPGEVSPLLRRCAYQLAPTVDKTKATSPGAEEGSSPRGTFGALNVWRKYRVDPKKVNEWTAFLRMWISRTVVERVSLEIDNICAALIRHGLSDSQPGHVGLDRLRKLAQAPFLVSAIPTLPTLVPFLELSNNQEYLVKRIKILAKGGCMSEFKWNSGGSHNGKEWDSSLPTDSAIIMHLISTYMDTQLEAPLDQPDARPFTSRYMARSGMELPRNKGPIIVCQSVNPPHYNLALSGDSLPSDYEEVQRGRNNLFHTLLLFLYIVKTRDHGMLGRVNAGSSGINILWVIDS